MKICTVVVLFLMAAMAGSAQTPAPQTAAAGSQPADAATSSQKKIDPARDADIRRVLELAGSKKMLQSTLDAMSTSIRPLMTNALPPGEYREELVDLFFARFQAKTDLDHFIDLAVPIYAKYYSDAEIKELIKFYETPVGQKFASVTPLLSNELREAGQAWGREIGAATMKEVLAEHEDLAEALEAAAKARSPK